MAEYNIAEPRKMTPYEQGEWDMFELISSITYGKQMYALEENGMVYSRHSHGYMTVEKAYKEYMDYISW